MISFKKFLLMEGGAGGHEPHPYDIASTGPELIQLFREAIPYLFQKKATVKIDGTNLSVRLVDGEFVLDRGAIKDPRDLNGIKAADLEASNLNDGLKQNGKIVLDIMNAALPYTKSSLKKLGVLDNPNLILNLDFVDKNKVNVIEYPNVTNFLSIHGLRLGVTEKDSEGKVIRRTIRDTKFDSEALNSYTYSLNIIGKKKGFAILGPIQVTLKSKPDLDSILKRKVKFGDNTKTLQQWLENVTISHPMRTTRKRYKELMASGGKDATPRELNDSIVYYAAISLGDEILKHCTSTMGPLNTQEGLVIRSGDRNFKITGSFILKSLDSPFQE